MVEMSFMEYMETFSILCKAGVCKKCEYFQSDKCISMAKNLDKTKKVICLIDKKIGLMDRL